MRKINAALMLFVLALPVCLALCICPAQASIIQEASTLDLHIYNVSVSNVGYHSAVVRWQTNINASSQVFYDTRFHYYIENYSYHTPEDDTPVTEHRLRLSGLAAGTDYHFRVRSVAGSTEATSSDYTFRPLEHEGGGSGDGDTPASDYRYLTVDVNGDTTEWPIDTTGHLITAVNVLKADDEISIHIPDGTCCLNPDRRCLYEIAACCDNEDIEYCTACARENDYTLLGKTYDIGPNGSTFSPYAEVTLFYDEQDIPAGLTEQDLCIGWCDGGEWVPLASSTDAAANSVSTRVSHLSIFSVMAKPSPKPPPAVFSLDRLDISPAEVKASETVTITIAVTNTGGTTGRFPVSLLIDGTLEETEGVLLAPGESKTVTFGVTRPEPGVHTVTIGGLSGSFTVREASEASPQPLWPPPSRNNWLWLIITIITGIIIYITVRRKRKKDSEPQE